MNQHIPIKKEIKYLAVMLDFGKHIEYVSAKAEKVSTSLSRIMPRVGGVGENKRKILSGAIRGSHRSSV